MSKRKLDGIPHDDEVALAKRSRKCHQSSEDRRAGRTWLLAQIAVTPKVCAEVIYQLVLANHRGGQIAWALVKCSKAWHNSFSCAKSLVFERLLDPHHDALRSALKEWQAAPQQFPWPMGMRYEAANTVDINEVDANIGRRKLTYRPWVLAWAHERYSGPVSDNVRAEVLPHLEGNSDWTAAALLGKRANFIGTLEEHKLPYPVMRIFTISCNCIGSVHQMVHTFSRNADHLAAFLLFISRCHISNGLQVASTAQEMMHNILPRVMRDFAGEKWRPERRWRATMLELLSCKQ